MITTVNANTSFNFGPNNVVEEVTQNIATLLSTIKFSVPYDRNLGINPDYLDDITPVTKAKLTADVINVLREHEPRAEVKDVTFTESEQGTLIPAVKVAING